MPNVTKKDDKEVPAVAPTVSKSDIPGREPHQDGEYPDFPGDAKQDYVDINNPDHGNKTYEELQKQNSKK